MNHQEVLEKILFEKKMSKRELAELIGYSKSNYSLTLNKETYTEKMIKKISTALGIEPTVFNISAVVGDNHGIVMQTITLADRVAELESRIRDKDEIIEGLREKLRRYEGMN
jgi:transcriptional regulator with XRE-family HTH domain